MRTLNKIEQIIVIIACAIVIATTSIIGMFELLYNSLDMYYDQAVAGMIVYGVVVIYWVIKKTVFKIIRIIKN